MIIHDATSHFWIREWWRTNCISPPFVFRKSYLSKHIKLNVLEVSPGDWFCFPPGPCSAIALIPMSSPYIHSFPCRWFMDFYSLKALQSTTSGAGNASILVNELNRHWGSVRLYFSMQRDSSHLAGFIPLWISLSCKAPLPYWAYWLFLWPYYHLVAQVSNLASYLVKKICMNFVAWEPSKSSTCCNNQGNMTFTDFWRNEIKCHCEPVLGGPNFIYTTEAHCHYSHQPTTLLSLVYFL